MNICIYGSASPKIDKKYITEVEKLGEYLAKRGHNLVFGAGGTGLMGASARGFKNGGGKRNGVIPRFFMTDTIEPIEHSCENLIFTETMRDRKATMEDLADAFIITPGGIGTFEEFFEILTLKQLNRHRKQIAVYNIDGYYDILEAMMEDSIKKEFINDGVKGLYQVFDRFESMIEYLESEYIPQESIRELKNL